MLKIREEIIEMKRVVGDVVWAGLLLIWIVILVMPVTRTGFIQFTEIHPYLGGFFKFFVLASMGDMLGIRILKGQWEFPDGFFLKAVVWGILGMMITLVFTVFFTGAAGAQASGRLPFESSKVALAFFGSFLMNTTFGPMMYIYHKFGDMYVDMMMEKKKGKLDHITLRAMVDRVDWYGMVSFSWLKTCLFIWIPLHTIVFLLPPEYRVLASAFLSILLGIIVANTKKSALKATKN